MESKVKLFVKIRPTTDAPIDCVKFIDKKIVQIIRNRRVFELNTDGIYDNISQHDFYSTISQLEVIKNVLNGFNSVIMVYGRFDSGKFHTIKGSHKGFHDRGLIPRFLTELFTGIALLDEVDDVKIRISSLQIHGDVVLDLLCPEGITETTLDNVSSHEVKDEEDAMCLFFLSVKQREIFKSKRSRSGFKYTWANYLFQIDVEIKKRILFSEYLRTGTLKFITIAGCVGDLHEPLSRDELLAREMLAIWENNMNARGFCPKSKSSGDRKCKLSYLLRDTQSCQFIVILTVCVTNKDISSLYSTIQFGKRITQGRRKTATANVKDCTTDIYGRPNKEVKLLKSDLNTYQIIYKKMKPVDSVEVKDNQLLKLYENVTTFLSNEFETVEVSNRAELNAAFEIMRNLYTTAKEKFVVRQKHIQTLKPTQIEMPKAVEPSFEAASSKHSLIRSNGVLDEDDVSAEIATKESKMSITTIQSSYLHRKKSFGAYSVKSRILHSNLNVIRKRTSAPTITFPTRDTAFEYFKTELMPHLNKQLHSYKANIELKKEKYNKILKEIRKCKEIEKSYTSEEFNPTTVNEDIYDLEDIKKINWKKKSLMTEALALLSTVNSLKKMVHETRVHFMQEFERWFDLKLDALSYQHMFQDPEYVSQSDAAVARQDHRVISERIKSLPTEQAVYELAKQRVSLWIRHSVKRRQRKSQNFSNTFDFLQKVTID